MKVSDILSTATTGSSRALSAFAAIVIVIVASGTQPKEVPVIEFIKVHAGWHYAVSLGLLLYMAFAHFMNWRHDTRSMVRDDALKGVEGLQEVSDDFERSRRSQSEVDTPRNAFEAGVTRAKEKWRQENKRVYESREIITHGMHFAVPFGLAWLAVILLLLEIFDCVRVGCS